MHPQMVADAIAREFPEICIMAEKKNHGLADANNIAAEHARGKHILLLNPDMACRSRLCRCIVETAINHAPYLRF